MPEHRETTFNRDTRPRSHRRRIFLGMPKRFLFRGFAGIATAGFLSLIPADPYRKAPFCCLHVRDLGAWRAAGPE